MVLIWKRTQEAGHPTLWSKQSDKDIDEPEEIDCVLYIFGFIREQTGLLWCNYTWRVTCRPCRCVFSRTLTPNRSHSHFYDLFKSTFYQSRAPGISSILRTWSQKRETCFLHHLWEFCRFQQTCTQRLCHVIEQRIYGYCMHNLVNNSSLVGCYLYTWVSEDGTEPSQV